MKRFDRTVVFAVAALTHIFWLCGPGAIVSGEPPIQQESPESLELRNPPVPKPDILAGWGDPPGDLERASMTEAVLLRSLESKLPSKPAPEGPSQADKARASALAEKAERTLEAGSQAEAAALLRQALRLSPDAPDLWSRFARVLRDQGNPIGAKSAFAEAVALGDRDFDTLLGYGLLAAQFREDDNAIAALSLASQQSTDDAGAPFVLADALARSLARRGYLAAAVTRYEELLSLPETFNDATEYREQLNEVYRNRRDSMMRAAEASHSMQQWQQLDRFLAASASIPGPAHHTETAIRCYVLVQTGRPERAAEMLVADFGSDPAAPQIVRLLEYVADHANLGPALDRALSQRAAELPAGSRENARQSITLARAAVARDDQARRSLLLDHLHAYPSDRAIWLDLLESDPDQMVARILASHPALEPDVSQLALRMHGPLETDPGTPLALRSALRRGDFAAALDQFLQIQPIAREGDTTLPPVDPALLCLGVDILVDAARGQEADRLLEAARHHADSPKEMIAAARGFLIRGRFRDARQLLIASESHPEVRSGDDILRRRFAMEIAFTLGDLDQAVLLAAKSLQRNPDDFDAAVFISRHSDPQDATARLRDILGADAELDRIRSRIATEREQYDLAERLLRAAWHDPLRPAGTAHQLVELWLLTGSVDRAEEWLLEQTSRLPDEPDLAVLLSSLRRTDRRPEEALDVLASAMMERPGSSTLSRELESMLRDDFDATDRWLSQARARLTNAPDTFATFTERAEIELAAGHVDQAISLAELAADLAPTLHPSEQRAMNTLLEGVSRDIINRPRVRPETVTGFVRVFDRLDAPTADAWRGRISVASIDRSSSEEDLVDLALQAGNDLREFRQDAFIHAAQAVMISSRTGQSMLQPDDARQAAIFVYSEATRHLEPFPSRVLGDWIDFTQQIQDPFALGEAIRSLGGRQGPQDRRLLDALNYLLLRGSTRVEQSANTEMLAEGASYLASQLALNDQFDTAKLLYEEILRIDPDHIETNNSYGYRLLEAGEQVDRAIRMIELAYSLAPNQAHIIDSMGWARYKQGQLQDEVDPATGMVRAGAVSLLRQAKTLSIQVDPTGLNSCYTVDHLGDALWADGQRDQAILEWTEAATIATRASKGIRGTPLPLSIEVELKELIENIEAKVRAASEDRPPNISPQLK